MRAKIVSQLLSCICIMINYQPRPSVNQSASAHPIEFFLIEYADAPPKSAAGSGSRNGNGPMAMALVDSVDPWIIGAHGPWHGCYPLPQSWRPPALVPAFVAGSLIIPSDPLSSVPISVAGREQCRTLVDLTRTSPLVI